jgi:hypothetical protein
MHGADAYVFGNEFGEQVKYWRVGERPEEGRAEATREVGDDSHVVRTRAPKARRKRDREPLIKESPQNKVTFNAA